MRSFALLTISVLLFTFNCLAQLQLRQERSYVPGVKMTKVMVCQEDHTVLALSESGKVYYKRITDSDFQVYGPASGLLAAEVTGFNYNEIYVRVEPNLIYYFKNGQRTEIKILVDGVTRINNIGAVSDRRNVSIDYYDEDWLAIATDKGLYPLFRNSILANLKYPQPFVNPSLPDAAAYITNSNFKFLDIRYDYPNVGICYTDADYVYHNRTGGAILLNILPEHPPYAAEVNTTLFDLRFYEVGQNNYWDRYCLWGSEDGVFGKYYLTCRLPVKIFSKPVNDLEELDLLFTIGDERFILVASNEGLYYSGTSLKYTDQNPTTLDNLTFLPFGPDEQINSIATEIYLSGDGEVYYNNSEYCEKVVWLATESGLKEISVGLNGDYFTQYPLANRFSFAPGPGVTQLDGDRFVLCNGSIFNVTLNIPENSNNRLFVNWFIDGAEVPELAGRTMLRIAEKGTYYAEITAVCENVKMKTKAFTVEETASPQLTFAYPNQVNLCEGENYPMETRFERNYNYRWYKDEELIPGAITNQYTATISGKYKVEANSCNDIYVSSSTVNVRIDALPVPVILADKTSYCGGDLPRISVSNPLGYHTRWYFNNNELTAAAGTNGFSANAPGSYQVSFEGSAECPKQSVPLNIMFGPAIDITAITTLSSPCNGTAGSISNVVVSGTGTLRYRWLDQANVVKASGTVSGTIVGLRGVGPGSYRLEIKDESSCPAVVSVPIPISESSGFNIDERAVHIGDEDCSYLNGSITGITVEGASTIQWLNEDGEIAGRAENLTGVKAGKYHLVATNANGCTRESSVYEVVGPVRVTYALTAKINDISCTHDIGTIEMINNGEDEPLAYRWADTSGNNAGTGPKLEGAAGTYTLYLTDINHCERLYASFSINNARQALVAPVVSDVKLCASGDALIQVSNAREGTYVLYDDQGVKLDENTAGSFHLNVNENAAYTVIHRLGNCESPAATVSIAVETGGLTDIANTFSPNGDGLNDYWQIPGMANYPDGVVAVFNRQGTKVFQSTGYKEVFNGKYKGADLPVSTYYYIIDLKRTCGLLTGSLTIIR